MSSDALDITKISQFIRAGAGAGKTTRLIGTFLNFVKNFKKTEGRFPRVIITTFTRKATQEVKERLLVSSLQQNEKEIFEYINQKSYVHISTIHGVLSLFLKQYSDRIKFPQEIRIIDGPQYQRVLKKQINEILKKDLKFLDLLETYSFAKLVEISNRALEHKAQNSNFSCMTDQDLREYALKQKNEIIVILNKIFFQSGNTQKSWIPYIAYLRQLQTCIEIGSHQELIALLEEAPRKPPFKTSSPNIDPVAHELILELLDRLDELYDSDIFIDQHQKLNQLFNEFIEVLYFVNFEYKRRTGELTLADLESLALQIIEKFPDSAEEFSSTWDYFMLDEYQDTSPLQVKILNAIIRDKTCFVVGDPQQSIYLFRGARSEVFEKKQTEMQQSGAQVDFLETNYRSEPTLMNFINLFFSEFSNQFKPMLIKPVATDSKNNYDAYFLRSDNQAFGALQHIQELIKDGKPPQDICVLSRNNKNLKELALLAGQSGINVQLQAASGFEETREILDLIAFNKFLNNPHDDENLVTLVRSPWFYISDDLILEWAALKHSARSSFWSVASQISGSQVLGSPNRDAVIENLIKYLNLFDRAGVLQTTKQFILEKSFVSASLLYDSTGKREANIFKYLSVLAQAEKVAGFSLGLFLEEQFQTLQIESGSGNSEAQPVVQPNCVSLMTIHASKGLQFKHVIVMGFADKVKLSNTQELSFDSQTQKYSLSVFDESEMKYKASNWAIDLRREFNRRELAESDRLLYVAMTRAIETLCLIHDTSKRADKNSWSAKRIWPQPGEVNESNFKTLALEYVDQVEMVSSQKKNVLSPRSMFVNNQLNEEESQSVTDLISRQLGSVKISAEIQLSNLKKAQYGTDLHRVFESLKYLDYKTVVEKLNVKDRSAVEYLFELKEIDLAQILKFGHNEWGFGLKTKSRFIQGQIDLWAELEDSIHVLDYKTGSPDNYEKATEQLSFYTKALFEMKKISENKKVIHSVIYPLSKSIRIKEYSNKKDFEQKWISELKEIF